MNIRKTIIAVAFVAAVAPCMAQSPAHHPNKGQQPKDITEIVGDLNATQKKRLDAITDASRERVSALRSRQKAVRDSIAMYMKLDGDQSRYLFPLFDREAQLQRDISREMYTTKVHIDEVLTPEQRQQVRQVMSKTRKDSHKKRQGKK